MAERGGTLYADRVLSQEQYVPFNRHVLYFISKLAAAITNSSTTLKQV
jgi:hypothetical protein